MTGTFPCTVALYGIQLFVPSGVASSGDWCSLSYLLELIMPAVSTKGKDLRQADIHLDTLGLWLLDLLLLILSAHWSQPHWQVSTTISKRYLNKEHPDNPNSSCQLSVTSPPWAWDSICVEALLCQRHGLHHLCHHLDGTFYISKDQTVRFPFSGSLVSCAEILLISSDTEKRTWSTLCWELGVSFWTI